MQKIQFEVKRDNLVIRGYVYATSFEEKRPAIICSHGFMADYHMCEGYAKKLCEEGYIAFAYDFCGGGLSDFSDGEREKMSVLTEKDDLKAVISYVKGLDYVDESRISLLGCSQGGFVSAMVAHDMKDSIESLVLLYPALCIPDDARRGNLAGAEFDTNNIPDTLQCGMMTIGKVYVEDAIKIDPYAMICDYKGPVLLIHGVKDRVVNIEYSRKASKLYNDCTYVEIENADHVFFGEDDICAIEHITKFSNKIEGLFLV